MIPSICTKMQNLINEGITTEAELVYLLSRIRKIIEPKEIYPKFGFLKFYCDWALHSKLSGRDAQEIITEFNKLDFKNDDITLPSKLGKISNFTNLYEEMKNFTNSYDIVFPEAYWDTSSKLTHLYASIVEDSPLILNVHINKNSKIKKITLRVEDAEEIKSGQQYYKVSWLIKDIDDNDNELFVINSFDT